MAKNANMPPDNGDAPDTHAIDVMLKGSEFPPVPPSQDESIEAFFKKLLKEKGMSKAAVIRKANIARVYGYQIFKGSRIAARDYYLQIAIAMRLDLDTTQRLLKVVRHGALYSKNYRDAAIIFAINQGYEVDEVHEFLCKLLLLPLEKEIKFIEYEDEYAGASSEDNNKEAD